MSPFHNPHTFMSEQQVEPLALYPCNKYLAKEAEKDLLPFSLGPLQSDRFKSFDFSHTEI